MRLQSLIYLLISILFSVAAFQNCAPKTANSNSANSAVSNISLDPTESPSSSQLSSAQGYLFNPDQAFQPQCLFNGQVVPEGHSVTAFSASTVPAGFACASQTRLCQNGILQGSGDYATCWPEVAASCLFNGQQIPSGGSVLAYEASRTASSEPCQAQTRVCTDGILSGTAAFATCSPGASTSCVFNGVTYPTGASLNAFAVSQITSDQVCQVSQRVCVNGIWSGQNDFSSCALDSADSGHPVPTVFNFVGSSQASCEAQAQQRLGVSVTCTKGGACGTTCGAPGPNCPSSQPDLWGACVSSQ